MDKDRFGGLTACDTRRIVYGAERRAILTYSPELRDSQARGFDGTTLAKAGKKLDELAATLARGQTRRPRDKVEAEITAITSKPWVRRVIRWELTGDQPKDLRLTWHADPGRPRRPGRGDLRQARGASYAAIHGSNSAFRTPGGQARWRAQWHGPPTWIPAA